MCHSFSEPSICPKVLSVVQGKDHADRLSLGRSSRGCGEGGRGEEYPGEPSLTTTAPSLHHPPTCCYRPGRYPPPNDLRGRVCRSGRYQVVSPSLTLFAVVGLIVLESGTYLYIERVETLSEAIRQRPPSDSGSSRSRRPIHCHFRAGGMEPTESRRNSTTSL